MIEKNLDWWLKWRKITSDIKQNNRTECAGWVLTLRLRRGTQVPWTFKDRRWFEYYRRFRKILEEILDDYWLTSGRRNVNLTLQIAYRGIAQKIGKRSEPCALRHFPAQSTLGWHYLLILIFRPREPVRPPADCKDGSLSPRDMLPKYYKDLIS